LNAFGLMASQDHQDYGMSAHKMSGNSCKRCSHCDSHYYWHHLDDRQKHFFKLMLGDFQQKMVRIPSSVPLYPLLKGTCS
jgi:hypothetical protein